MTIRSQIPNQKYRDNYDRIFKKDCPQCHTEKGEQHKMDCSERGNTRYSRQAPIDKFPTTI